MDHHNGISSREYFSTLSIFPQFTKNKRELEKAAELRLFLADIQEKGRRRFRNPQPPFYSPSLQLVRRRDPFPHLPLSWGKSCRQWGCGSCLDRSQPVTPQLLLQTGLRKVTSTFNNGSNKALIIFLQSPDYISVSKTRQIKLISANICGQIHLQNFDIWLRIVHKAT